MTLARAHAGFYGWKLLAAFWAILFINLAFPAYGASVINAYMVEDLGLDRRTLGLMVSAYMLMTGLPAPLAAVYVNRVGVRRTLVTGSLIILLGALAMATVVDSGAAAIAVYGFLIGLGVMTGGMLATQTGAALWFVRRRALATAIILSAGGIGGFAAARVLSRLIESFDGNWRAGWWLIAGGALLSAAIAALFVRERPEDLGQRPDGAQVDDHEGRTVSSRVHITADDWSFADALRSPVLWMLLFCSLGMSGGFVQVTAHGVVHLQDLGNSPAAAADTFSIVVVSTLLGKIMLGVFGDRIDPRYLWALAVGLSGIGLLLLLQADTLVERYAFAVCTGAGFGGGVVCMMTVMSNYIGSAAYASVLGIVLATQTTVGAIASYVAGDLYERIGTYTPAFVGAAAMCFAGALLLVFIRPPRLHATARAGDAASQAKA